MQSRKKMIKKLLGLCNDAIVAGHYLLHSLARTDNPRADDIEDGEDKLAQCRAIATQIAKDFEADNEQRRIHSYLGGPSWLSELTSALGWQGGTWTQAIDEVKCLQTEAMTKQKCIITSSQKELMCVHMRSLQQHLDTTRAELEQYRDKLYERIKEQCEQIDDLCRDVRQAAYVAPDEWWGHVLDKIKKCCDPNAESLVEAQLHKAKAFIGEIANLINWVGGSQESILLRVKARVDQARQMDGLQTQLNNLQKELEQAHADHKKSREEATLIQEDLMSEVRKAVGVPLTMFWNDVLKKIKRYADRGLPPCANGRVLNFNGSCAWAFKKDCVEDVKPDSPAPTCGMCEYFGKRPTPCQYASIGSFADKNREACKHYVPQKQVNELCKTCSWMFKNDDPRYSVPVECHKYPAMPIGGVTFSCCAGYTQTEEDSPKMLACASCKHYSETGVLSASGKLNNCLGSDRQATQDPLNCALYAKKDEGSK